jgi:hypothetical protein
MAGSWQFVTIRNKKSDVCADSAHTSLFFNYVSDGQGTILIRFFFFQFSVRAEGSVW